MIKSVYKSIFYIGILWALIYVDSNAQSNWYVDTLRHSAKFEFSKAEFTDLINTEYGGFGLFVSANYYVGRNIWITAEIPYANSKIEREGYNYGTFIGRSYREVGNPFIGVRVWDKKYRFYNDVGIRYPFSDYSDRGYIGGALSNIEKAEAFQVDYISFEWIFNYIHYSRSNFYPRFYLGPLVYFPDRHSYDNDSEVFLNYGFDIYIDHDYLGICFGIGVINYLTNSNTGEDDTEAQLGFGPNFRIKNANFGMRLNTPLLGADLNRYVGFAVNTYVQIKL